MAEPREAHLRFFRHNGQCILYFDLKYELEGYGEVTESVQSVRQIAETVDALLTHTKNKLAKLFVKKLQTKDPDASAPTIGDAVLSNKNKALHGSTPLTALETMKRLRLELLGVEYAISVNRPLVTSLRLPDVVYAGHGVQPDTYRVLLGNRELSTHKWYRSNGTAEEEEWTEVGEGYNYTARDEDVGSRLKFVCTPRNQFGAGVPDEAVSEQAVQRMPELPRCPFEDRHAHTPHPLNGNQFRVVSYNTLSCRYTSNQYEHCPKRFLSIDYRKQLLLKELVGYKSDIICLQEVDNRVHSFYFRKAFADLGYGSVYNKKGDKLPEGLAIVYNKNRFSFAGQGHIVFSSEIKENGRLRNLHKIVAGDDQLAEIFLKQATSLQYVKLKSKNASQLVIVANTHLYYHPEASNVRLIQAALCLEYLKHEFNQTVKKMRGVNVSVIFCGDFNSTPSSDVYRFLTEGSIRYDSDAVSTTLFHPFQFVSASGTPDYTNYTVDFKACLDYVFCCNVAVLRSVPLPDERVLAENEALPSAVFPSDHLALVVDLQFN